ncbi:MAG TPA: glycosyltransferase family 39 protein [Planctomycetota bacterium]|nr:glycosyltransferase family 39 protein [Planctomycetota bacterium]
MTLRRPKETITLGVLLVVGAALRFWNVGAESLWQDEAWSWGLIQGGPKDLVLRLYRFDAHPPLYFLCLQAWSVFGGSEAWLRALSVALGLGSIPLLYRLASRIGGPKAGLLASGFLTISPYHVYYSREARSYALLFLLCIVSLDLLLDLAAQRHRGKWVAFAGVSAAILLTHYMGAFFLAAEAGVALLLRRDRPGFLKEFALAAAGAAVLYLPWFPAFYLHVTTVNQGFWLPSPTATIVAFSLCSLVASPLFMGTPGYLVGWSFYGAAFAGLRGRLAIALLPVLLFPPLGELLVSLHRPLFYAQTFQYILIPLFILAAVGITRLPSGVDVAAAALGCLALLPGLARTETQLVKEDWRGAVAWIGSAVGADELLVVQPGFVGIGLERYAESAPWWDRVRLVDAGDMARSPVPRKAVRAELEAKAGLWLVFRHGGDEGWFADLEKDFTRVDSFKSRGVEVHHFRRK